MKHSKATNILQRLIEDGHSVNEVYEAKTNAYTAPLANMILDSARIEARATEPWMYKSLAHWGEELYVRTGHIYIDPSQKNDWIQKAIKDFSYDVCVNILYEEEEGLALFVRDGDTYREARKGDIHYDYVCRLRADSALFDLKFPAAPTWATELFIQYANYEAYRLFWHDLSSVNDRRYSESKRAKADAVRRETKRLMGDASLTIETNSEPTNAEKPLGTTERKTLLTIIAALAKAAKINTNEAGKAALSIEGLTAELGARVSKRAIEEHLKKIPDALETRMK